MGKASEIYHQSSAGRNKFFLQIEYDERYLWERTLIAVLFLTPTALVGFSPGQRPGLEGHNLILNTEGVRQ